MTRYTASAARPMPMAWQYIFSKYVSKAGGKPTTKYRAPMTATIASVALARNLSEKRYSWTYVTTPSSSGPSGSSVTLSAGRHAGDTTPSAPGSAVKGETGWSMGSNSLAGASARGPWWTHSGAM